MTRTPSPHLSRRNALAWIALVPLAPLAAHARDVDEFNPVDRVSRTISLDRFNELDKNEMYRYKKAVEQGRTILVGGKSASESRRMILDAER